MATRWLLGGALALVLTVGCDAAAPPSTGSPSAPATDGTTPASSLAPQAAPPFPTDGNGFDPERFGEDSTVIDNTYFPLVPGTQMTYEGSSIGDEGERIEHSVVFTVTGLTKEIAGVRAIVGWDRDFEDGDLVEKELIFFAQDVDGNVWHLGQYAETYEGEVFEGADPWLVGYIEGAMAGTAMPAEHAEGGPEYSQGYAPPPFFWDDYGRVYRTGERTCVPVDCYDDVLVIEEFELGKPGAFQLKFYAPGVGYVRVGWRGAREREREVLVLTGIRRLDAGELEEVHEEAFAMEARAVAYGMASPLEPAG